MAALFLPDNGSFNLVVATCRRNMVGISNYTLFTVLLGFHQVKICRIQSDFLSSHLKSKYRNFSNASIVVANISSNVGTENLLNSERAEQRLKTASSILYPLQENDIRTEEGDSIHGNRI